jgi:hypothetical protein
MNPTKKRELTLPKESQRLPAATLDHMRLGAAFNKTRILRGVLNA